MSGNLNVNTAATNGNEADTAEMKDATTNTSNQNTADVKGEAVVEEIAIVAAAGIETKIENYDNIRTQRRHFSEADEVIDITDKENIADSEGAVETDEVEVTETEEAAVIERKRIETEEAAVIEREKIETKETAVIERKKIENCEGVLSQRRHFPGTTTSNIFR